MRWEFPVQHWSRTPARAEIFELLRLQVTTGVLGHVLVLHRKRHVWRWWRNSGD
jgi:hypothetical protein